VRVSAISRRAWSRSTLGEHSTSQDLEARLGRNEHTGSLNMWRSQTMGGSLPCWILRKLIRSMTSMHAPVGDSSW
jgi:hypothetical protein